MFVKITQLAWYVLNFLAELSYACAVFFRFDDDWDDKDNPLKNA